MLNVLMIDTVNLEKNGITTFIINSSIELINNGVNVSIVATNNLEKNIQLILKKYKIRYYKLPNRKKKPFQYYQSLKRILKNNNFDVVHVHGNSTTMGLDLLAAKKAKVPLRIAHSHNTTTEHPMINKFLRPLFEFTVNSRIACNKDAGKWLFHNKEFSIIKNGINLNKYTFNNQTRNKIRSDLKISKKDIILGHVGLFNYQKNHDFFLKLLPQLNNKYKLVLLGGEGKEFNDFKKKVHDLHLSKRIILLGQVNNVWDYLNCFDFFLLPSRFEGQPFVIIEALASGLPCIISANVSKEVDVTDNSIFLPLNTKIWKSKIDQLNISDRFYKSNNNIIKLRLAGYDAIQNGKILKQFYSKKLQLIK